MINISSDIISPLSLTFKRNGTSQTAINSTVNEGIHNWIIPLSNYSIGDTLSEFTVSTSSKKPWELDEGVTVLIDGKEYDNIHTDSFTLNFDKEDEYTVECVFAGNDKLAMASTGKKTFKASQPTDIEDDTPTPTVGKYKLNFKDNNLKTLTYNDGKAIRFVLTHGGSAVRGKTIECVTPKNILSKDTDKNGEVFYTNTGFNDCRVLNIVQLPTPGLIWICGNGCSVGWNTNTSSGRLEMVGSAREPYLYAWTGDFTAGGEFKIGLGNGWGDQFFYAPFENADPLTNHELPMYRFQDDGGDLKWVPSVSGRYTLTLCLLANDMWTKFEPAN